MRLWWGWIVLGLAVGGVAQETQAPTVRFLNPEAEAIVQGVVPLLVEGEGFQELKTFGFADFFYAPEGGEFTLIGRDRNTFDGLSLGWDTTGLSDGAYTLRAEVTDLVNNRGAGTQVVFVNNRGNQAFTNRVARALAEAFAALARAVDFPVALSLLKAVEVVRANLTSAAETFTAALAEIEAIQADSPAVLGEADPFLRHIALFQRLAGAIAAARAGLEGLNLEAAQAALTELVSAARALAELAPNGVDFSPLAGVAQAIEQAADQLDRLLLAVQGDADQSVEEAFGEFLDLARGAIPPLEAVAEGLRRTDRDCPVTFSEADHPVAVHFRPGTDPKRVAFGSGTAAGELTLYDEAGRPLLAGALSEGRFAWDGRLGDGPAPAGRYFFVARFEAGGGERVKTGRLVVVAGP